MPETNASNPVTALQSFLNKFLRISINDGRVFLGSFLGTDQALNVLLMNTEEFRVMKIEPSSAKLSPISKWDGRLREDMELENAAGRFIGQIVIPWKEIVKIEAHHEKERTMRGHGNGLYI